MYRKPVIRFLILLVLLPLMLLQGCWLANMPVYVPPHVPAPPELEEPPVIIEQTPEPDASPTQGRFTIRYEPVNTLNPILAQNRDNIGIISLLYEPLFILDTNLVSVPLLCQSWETEDNITWTFTIYPDIAMHDGSTLTADDVAYTLRQARQRGRHRAKLRCIESISSDGELTVTITLRYANARFTRVLDVPIIKEETIESTIPPGTGPYIFPNTDNLTLIRFVNYRDFSDLQLSSIYLKVCTDSELTEFFDRGEISLLWDDPTSAMEVRINRDNSPQPYNTTALQFIGFNASTGVLRDPDVRRAIGCSLDRQHIVDNIMNDPRPGQTVAAPVAISPIFDWYDPVWEQRVIDPEVELAELLRRAGIEDYDSDGFLETADRLDFSLNFIVNVENSQKVAAAEYIAARLRQIGFSIDVTLRSWTDFIKDLENGDFDMYYGEVQFGADFDFSPLLLPADNTIDYGSVASSIYEFSITNFLAASTRDEVSLAGGQLCNEIRINAPFIPILYKRHTIYTPLGTVTGSAPSQSGIYYNFINWEFDLELLG